VPEPSTVVSVEPGTVVAVDPATVVAVPLTVVVVLDAAVVVVTAATHALFVMVFVSNVTAPFRASNWPVFRQQCCMCPVSMFAPQDQRNSTELPLELLGR
jgi:hypothetical protein